MVGDTSGAVGLAARWQAIEAAVHPHRMNSAAMGLKSVPLDIESDMLLRDFQSHPEPYLTVAELAECWLVGRKLIYKQIEAGTLPAIRLVHA